MILLCMIYYERSNLRGRATLRSNRFLIYPDKLTRRRIIVEEKEKGAANIQGIQLKTRKISKRTNTPGDSNKPARGFVRYKESTHFFFFFLSPLNVHTHTYTYTYMYTYLVISAISFLRTYSRPTCERTYLRYVVLGLCAYPRTCKPTYPVHAIHTRTYGPIRRCLQLRQQQVRASSGRRSLLTATFSLSPRDFLRACKRTIQLQILGMLPERIYQLAYVRCLRTHVVKLSETADAEE